MKLLMFYFFKSNYFKAYSEGFIKTKYGNHIKNL